MIAYIIATAMLLVVVGSIAFRKNSRNRPLFLRFCSIRSMKSRQIRAQILLTYF